MGKVNFYNLNLTAIAGEKITNVGENGSGNSTLLSVIMGNIKEHDGSIFINGTVGYLPQNLEGHEEKLAISHCIYNSGDEELIIFLRLN